MTAPIAALSQEAKLATFGDMLRASKKVQALEEAGERVESLQQLKDLGDASSIDRLAAFAAKHPSLTASIAPLSQEAKLATFGDMLFASKQLKLLAARGERVRDVKHLKDLARPTQSEGGQSGSVRQTNKIEAGQIWDKYVIVIGKDPMTPKSATCPLLVNLTDVIGQDGIKVFGAEVVVQLEKLTNWHPGIFAKLEIEGHASALRVRESISSAVSKDLGPTPKVKDLIEMVRRIQARDTKWSHKTRSEFPGLTKSARESQYKSYVKVGYRALEREKQRMFIKTLPLIERVVVVVHALLTWYHGLGKSGKQSLDV